MDRDQLAADVLAAVNSGSYTASIPPSLTIIPPERTQAQAKEQYQVIGTFTTKTTNNKNRNQNIQLAVDAIDGISRRFGLQHRSFERLPDFGGKARPPARARRFPGCSKYFERLKTYLAMFR